MASSGIIDQLIERGYAVTRVDRHHHHQEQQLVPPCVTAALEKRWKARSGDTHGERGRLSLMRCRWQHTGRAQLRLICGAEGGRRGRQRTKMHRCYTVPPPPCGVMSNGVRHPRAAQATTDWQTRTHGKLRHSLTPFGTRERSFWSPTDDREGAKYLSRCADAIAVPRSYGPWASHTDRGRRCSLRCRAVGSWVSSLRLPASGARRGTRARRKNARHGTSVHPSRTCDYK